MSFNQGELNEAAEKVFEFLSQHLPRRTNGWEKQEREGYIELVLQSSWGQEYAWASTANREITVGFGHYHMHCTRMGGEDSTATNLTEDMLLFLVNVVSGMTRSYSASHQGQCQGFGILEKSCANEVAFERFPQADSVDVLAWASWESAKLQRIDGVITKVEATDS
jgi:hypothetical protein